MRVLSYIAAAACGALLAHYVQTRDSRSEPTADRADRPGDVPEESWTAPLLGRPDVGRTPHAKSGARPVPAVPGAAPVPAPATGERARMLGRSRTLRDAIEPVYRAVFGSDDGARTIAWGELPDLNALLAVPDSVHPEVPAARRTMAHLNGAAEATRVADSKSRETASNALGGGVEATAFFREQNQRRWRTNMSQRAAAAAPDWRRLLDADAQAVEYAAGFEARIDQVFANRRVRELERTATLIEGTVAQTSDTGAVIAIYDVAAAARANEMFEAGQGGLPMQPPKKLVFVEGLQDLTDDSAVSVLAHRDGIHRFTSFFGEKTLEKWRFYRAAPEQPKPQAAPAEPAWRAWRSPLDLPPRR